VAVLTTILATRLQKTPYAVRAGSSPIQSDRAASFLFSRENRSSDRAREDEVGTLVAGSRSARRADCAKALAGLPFPQRSVPRCIRARLSTVPSTVTLWTFERGGGRPSPALHMFSPPCLRPVPLLLSVAIGPTLKVVPVLPHRSCFCPLAVSRLPLPSFRRLVRFGTRARSLRTIGSFLSCWSRRCPLSQRSFHGRSSMNFRNSPCQPRETAAASVQHVDGGRHGLAETIPRFSASGPALGVFIASSAYTALRELLFGSEPRAAEITLATG